MEKTQVQVALESSRRGRDSDVKVSSGCRLVLKSCSAVWRRLKRQSQRGMESRRGAGGLQQARNQRLPSLPTLWQTEQKFPARKGESRERRSLAAERHRLPLLESASELATSTPPNCIWKSSGCHSGRQSNTSLPDFSISC